MICKGEQKGLDKTLQDRDIKMIKKLVTYYIFTWFWYKRLPHLAQIISGTRHDRNKWISHA